MLSLVTPSLASATEPPRSAKGTIMLSGIVTSEDGAPLPYATVYVEGTALGATTDAAGRYVISLPVGEHTVTASTLGYSSASSVVDVASVQGALNFRLVESSTRIDEVVVSASGVGHLRRSAFNAVAIDTRALDNSAKNLSDALSKAPGIKLRESGGVGSDMAISLDGFTGKHVKIFIDGVPQEGAHAK